MTFTQRILAGAALVAIHATILAPTAAFAIDETNVSKGIALSGVGVAAHSYDVVSFFDGKPVRGVDTFAVVHDGATYRFASAANLAKFKAAPDTYAPAYGGYCAYGVALGKKLDGDPRYWKIVDGKLNLLLNGDVFETWKKDIAGNNKTADGKWATIRSTAIDKL